MIRNCTKTIKLPKKKKKTYEEDWTEGDEAMEVKAAVLRTLYPDTSCCCILFSVSISYPIFPSPNSSIIKNQ